MTILAPVAGFPTSGPTPADGRAISTTVGGVARPRTRRAGLLTALSDAASLPLLATAGSLTGASLPTVVVPTLTVVWVMLLTVFNAYEGVARRHDRRHVGAVARAGAVLGLSCWALSTFAVLPARSEELLAATVALTSSAVLTRAAAQAWCGRAALARGGTTVLVAGEPESVASSVHELRRASSRGWTVVGTCVTTQPDNPVLDVPVTVGMDDIAGAAAAAGAEAVLLLPCRELSPRHLRRIAWQLEEHGTRVLVGTGLLDVVPTRTAVVAAGDLHLVELGAPGGAVARMTKVVVEMIGAAMLLLILAPLMLAVAMAIRMDTRGPVIFRQVRVGRRGHEFVMYKFRTMSDGAETALPELLVGNESEGAVLFKIRQDPRITRVGALLRRYSVDELPQLLNVVRGQMALVGPRPALPGEVAVYDVDPRRRLAVRPGLTGLWQVSGRSDLSWEDTVRLDLHYVDNWSLGLDVHILVRTLRAVLRHDGAY